MLGEIWKIGDWLVFPAENTLRRDWSEVKVPPRLMDALIFFARHPDHVISRTDFAVGSNSKKRRFCAISSVG